MPMIDVLVIGGGSAALCAAIAARRRGAQVRMVEHAPAALRGGNSRHARNFRLMHDAPTRYVPASYSEAEFLADLRRVTGNVTNEPLAQLLMRGSADIAQWLEANGVQLQRPACGAMPYSRRTAFFLGGGKAMINALYAGAARLGVSICYDSEVVALRFGRDVCEVDIVHDGATERAAAKTLVVCAGGHQANLAWLRKDFGAAADGFAIRGTPYLTGALLRQLLDAGVKPVGDPKQCHMVAVDARGPRFDGGIVTRITAIPHGIVVDRDGRRFHDEAEDTRKTHYAQWGARIAACPGQIAYLILDAGGRARALPTALPPIMADSITALAAELGLPPAALSETITEFNAANGGERRFIAAPPFAAYPMRAGVTFTHYGVAIDPTMRVLTEDGRALDNVFAAGMIMAANVVPRGYLAGLGVTLSTVYGRLAGEEAARHAAR